MCSITNGGPVRRLIRGSVAEEDLVAVSAAVTCSASLHVLGPGLLTAEMSSTPTARTSSSAFQSVVPGALPTESPDKCRRESSGCRRNMRDQAGWCPLRFGFVWRGDCCPRRWMLGVVLVNKMGTAEAVPTLFMRYKPTDLFGLSLLSALRPMTQSQIVLRRSSCILTLIRSSCTYSNCRCGP